ncbi:MAG: hypothetical protein ACI8T1_000232 [Verrucomicrobiales bacterium]
MHLFQGQDGQSLVFSGILSPLNDSNVATVGCGRIERHPQHLSTLTEDQSQALMTARPSANPRSQGPQLLWNAFGSTTLPEIPWRWIYVGAFAYLVIIGPGHYFFGRSSRRDYRVTILVLLVLVGVFSWVFTKIGRRGYDEADRWMSAAIARPLGDGNFDVRQWSHAFVTKSDSYEFRFEGSNQLFEVQHHMDRVPGFIRGGVEGYLSLDLPLYSSRNLITRAVVKGPDIQVDVTRWSSDRPRRLEISGDAEIRKAWYYYDNQYYKMEKASSGDWEIYQAPS